MAKPIPVAPEKLADIAEARRRFPNLTSKLWIQDPMFGSFGVFAGQVWPSHFDGEEGEMIILDATTWGVTYVRQGRAWYMTADDFHHNLRTFPVIEGARRAQGAVRLAEVEIMFLAGAVLASGGAGMVLVLGIEAGKWVAENRENFPRWQRLGRAFLEVRDKLKTRTPTLYDQMTHVFWGQARANFWDSVTAEDVAFLLGQLLVSPGAGLLERTFQTAWKSMAKAALTVLKRVGVRGLIVTGKAVALTAAEASATADSIIEGLRGSGSVFDAMKIDVIRKEVLAHPTEVFEALQILQTAVSEAETMGR